LYFFGRLGKQMKEDMVRKLLCNILLYNYPKTDESKHVI
jgi:hypothetical protein